MRCWRGFLQSTDLLGRLFEGCFPTLCGALATVDALLVWLLFSALRAGILSSCFAKKKVAKEEGDPRVGVPFGDPLRYSAGRAAC
jgi:hypothetical protein